jgi:hypothetical protein
MRGFFAKKRTRGGTSRATLMRSVRKMIIHYEIYPKRTVILCLGIEDKNSAGLKLGSTTIGIPVVYEYKRRMMPPKT